MGLLVRAAVAATVRAASLMVLAACASGGASNAAARDPGVPQSPAPTPAPASPATTPPAPTTTDAPPSSVSTTGLSGGTVSTTTPAEDDSVWTDPKILAVLVAASQGDLEEANTAAELSHSTRIQHFADHMKRDDSVLGEKARELVSRIGTKDSASRLEVDVQRTGFVVAMREAPEEKVDRVFLKAQAQQCAWLVKLIDEQMYLAAKDPELQALLREMRAGAAHHIGVVDEMQSSLDKGRARGAK
jgi:predicted outer membrane protein